MRIGQRIELLMHCCQNIGMAVAETGNRGAARGVDIGLAAAVEQLDALAADGNGHHGIGGAVQNMGHDAFLLILDFRCVLRVARCWSVCRSVASASSPPRPAMMAPRISAITKAGDIAWKKDGLSVGTITLCC